MPDDSPLTQREFDNRIKELERVHALMVKREKEKVSIQLRSLARALKLQAKEYERRLQDLNHAHTQAQERNASYIPRETFDNVTSTLRGRIEALERTGANWQGRMVAPAAIAGIIASVIVGLAIRYLGGR